MKRFNYLLLALVLLTGAISAQTYTVSGKVVDYSSGEILIGANVFIKGTTIGAATDENGEYSLSVETGEYVIRCSYVGFDAKEYSIDVTNNMEVNFELTDYEFTLSVTVLADRAKERETPVAFTNVDKKEMEFTLGSRDIPLILNSTPSVYATEQGGGAGDARVNIRGFDQRNIAIMINGVPINDMENGWVYWSNWDGLSDATSSIQVQRGLSAVNLAVASIGGTMNVISDPTQQSPSVFYKTETGSGNFAKQSVFAHTGLVDDKFALSMGLVKKTGDGIAQGTFTDAWSYYMGAAYQIDNKNRIELYAMGAPQRHGQRSYKLNAATFSHDLARELGYTNEILIDPLYQEQGLNYNSNWNGAPSEYNGNQYYEMYWNTPNTPRYEPGHMWERQNYYHKPLVNLNWYSQFSDQFSLYTTAYWSGGKGGGTGTYGSMGWDYTNRQRVTDWQSTYERNINNTTMIDFDGDGDSTEYRISRGILRNSVNQQWTIGAISKAYYKVNKDLTVSFGVDWRHAEIDHYREVRDLVGGQYFMEFAGNDEFVTNDLDLYKRNGDKINYNNTNTVDWIGGFLQGEYTMDKLTFYGTAGFSMIKYDFIDYFKTADTIKTVGPTMGDPDINSGELQIETDWISGYQAKGGASFRVTPETDVYANFGYVSKVPIFDQVIDDVNSLEIDDPKNEKFLSAELGANFYLLEKKLQVKTNLYYTNWTDRGQSQGVQNADGSEGLVRLNGIDATHMGVEAEIMYQPCRSLIFDAAISKGIWEYGSDVSGSYIPDPSDPSSIENYNYYIDGLKVGDQPQFQVFAGLTVIPIQGLRAQLVWNFNSEYYSLYDPFSRTRVDREQVWQIPDFHLFDFHLAYEIPTDFADVTVFGHVFNLFDELYVSDATDASQYNGYYGNNTDLNGDGDVDNLDSNHSADDAEIFPGLPRNFKAGFSIRF